MILKTWKIQLFRKFQVSGFEYPNNVPYLKSGFKTYFTRLNSGTCKIHFYSTTCFYILEVDRFEANFNFDRVVKDEWIWIVILRMQHSMSFIDKYLWLKCWQVLSCQLAIFSCWILITFSTLTHPSFIGKSRYVQILTQHLHDTIQLVYTPLPELMPGHL